MSANAIGKHVLLDDKYYAQSSKEDSNHLQAALPYAAVALNPPPEPYWVRTRMSGSTLQESMNAFWGKLRILGKNIITAYILGS